MRAKTLMVLGSSSSAGKSLITTALCRIYTRRGFKVLPFKAQNMSNNAAVCIGGEIGRAQAMQAQAAKVDPTVDMNPILLKPEADSRSQIIVHGKVWNTLSASEYYLYKNELWGYVTQSLDRLLDSADIVFIEGAGSAAELNLKHTDMVNFAVAKYAHSPCILVGDIDRGGIFAQLLGTQMLLEEEERKLLVGFIVNKFRGDRALFQRGIDILEQRSGIPVLGVIPYLINHGVAEEDSAELPMKQEYGSGTFDVAIIALPHISNFDEFDVLKWIPDVRVRFVSNTNMLGSPKAIILPGSKNTIEDMQWLHDSGFADRIIGCAAQGCSVVGLCGGFQMLGNMIVDPYKIESKQGDIKGLGLLKGKTVFHHNKTVTLTKAKVINDKGFWNSIRGEVVEGYEIHLGDTSSDIPLLEITHRNGLSSQAVDGASSIDGRIFGSYLHGLLENDRLREAWLKDLGWNGPAFCYHAYREEAIDRLADVVSESLDLDVIDKILGV